MKKILFMIGFGLTVLTASTLAQVSPEQAIVNARVLDNDIKTRSIELERVNREGYKQPAGGEFTPEFPRIKDDFEQIQKINSSVIQKSAVNTQTDYAAVLKSVSEINRRAARLRSNLFPTRAEEKNQDKQTPPAAVKDLKPLLGTLDQSINSFVHSPLFQNTNVVNLQDSLKAQKDLESVIEISGAIKIKIKAANK